jgi:hypothetical protein
LSKCCRWNPIRWAGILKNLQILQLQTKTVSCILLIQDKLISQFLPIKATLAQCTFTCSK